MITPSRTLSKQLRPLAYGLVVVVVLVLALTLGSLELEVSVAGLLNGESEWSKAEKQATVELDRYAESGSSESLARFKEEIDVINTDRLARNAVESGHFNYRDVAKQFMQGRVLPDAVPSCIFALEYLSNVEFLHNAFSAWHKTDSADIELNEIANRLVASHQGQPLSKTDIQSIRERIYDLNIYMTPLTKIFSKSIATGATWFTHVLFWAVALVTLFALLIWFMMAKRILSGINLTEDRYQKLFDGAGDAIVIVDETNDTILDCNEAARSWAGNALVGRHFATLFSDERFIYSQQPTSSALIGHDGVTRPVETTTSAIFWGNKRVRQATIRDISDRVAIERERRVAAVMGHEMRNPLNAIINASRLLDDSVESKESKGLLEFIIQASSVLLVQRGFSGQRELPDAIRRSALRLLDKQGGKGDAKNLLNMMVSNSQLLLTRLNDVIDMVAINDGKLSFLSAPFSIEHLVALINDETQPQARAKFQTLQIVSDINPKLILVGDARRIQQSVSNIIGNSIKYSPEHSAIDVSLRATNLQEESVRLEFVVADQGVGIPNSKKSQIFEPFYQARRTDSHNYDGLGIGLFLVRTVSETIGGKITVEDNPGGGTVVIWSFPLPRASAVDTAAADVPLSMFLSQHKRSVAALRCLVVDDTVSNRAIMRHMLHRAGHSVDEASGGFGALAAMKHKEYDVVLLDMHMPGMSGADVLEEIKRLTPHTARRPEIIVISADTSVNRTASASHDGALAFLPKPVVIEELMKLLAGIALKRYGAANNPDMGSLVFDIAALTRASRSHVDILRDTLDSDSHRAFLSSCDEGIGEQVRAIEKALVVQSNDDLHFAIHALKGEFLNIDYVEGVQWCNELSQSHFADISINEFRSNLRQNVAEARTMIARL